MGHSNKPKNGRLREHYLNLELGKKMALLFLTAGILPITLLFGIAVFRIARNSQDMQTYMLNKGFEQTAQSIDDMLRRVYRVSTMVTVYDKVREMLQPGQNLTQIEELQAFEEISDYTYEVEMSSEDITVLYYINDTFIIADSSNTCFRSMLRLKDTSLKECLLENNGRALWRVVKEKNRYGQTEEYLAVYRAVWNEEKYSEMIGATAVMIPVRCVQQALISSMRNQVLYLQDERGYVLVSSGKIPGEMKDLPEGGLQENFEEMMLGEEEYLVCEKEMEDENLSLVSAALAEEFSADTVRIVKEMFLWFLGICALAACLMIRVSRHISGEGSLLDMTFEVSQDVKAGDSIGFSVNPEELAGSNGTIALEPSEFKVTVEEKDSNTPVQEPDNNPNDTEKDNKPDNDQDNTEKDNKADNDQNNTEKGKKQVSSSNNQQKSSGKTNGTASKSNPVKTGDRTNLFLPAAGICISLLSFAAVIRCGRKRNRNQAR